MKKNTKITIITLITLISIIFISVIIIKNTNKVNANSKSEEKINTTEFVEKPTIEKSILDNTLDKKNDSYKKNNSDKKTDSNKNDKTKSNKNDSDKTDSNKNDKTDSNKNTSDNSNKTESTTEAKTETTTEAPKKDNSGKKEEGTTQKPKQESTTEKPKENNTEAPKKETTTEAKTETKTEAKKEEACSHDWVWKTHTVHHDAVTHEEQYLIGDAWDEAVYVQKVKCSVCGTIYENTPDYNARDNCMGSFGHVNVIDHYIHHDAEYGTYTVTDKEAYDEEVKDYQYCSKCGQKK